MGYNWSMLNYIKVKAWGNLIAYVTSQVAAIVFG